MLRSLSAFALLVLATPAFAQSQPAPAPAPAPEKKFPVVKAGATLFGQWAMDLSEGAAGANEFAVSRVYLISRAELSEALSMRVTLDADTLKTTTISVPNADGTTTDTTVPADTKVRAYVKHAYLEWKTPASGVKVRAGMTDTAWAPYHDGFLGTRYLSKEAGDLYKWHSTADLGVMVHGDHAKGLLGWQLGVVNGEGYDKPEIDASKTVQARVTVDPLAKGGSIQLPISAHASQSFGGEGDAIQLLGGGVGLKMPYLGFWGEVLTRAEGDERGLLLSVTALPRVPKVGGLIARVDRLDADTSGSGEEELRLVGGVYRDFMDKVSLAATFERAAVGEEAEQGVYLKMQAGF